MAAIISSVNCADSDATFRRTPDDFVVNVSDIAHVGHLHAAGLQPPLNHIKRQSSSWAWPI